MLDEEVLENVRAFALLGLGSRGKNFRGRQWSVPGGHMGYIRWRDPDKYPTTTLIAEPDEEPQPQPEEWSDEHYDVSFDGGRFAVHVETADSYEEALAHAQVIADAFLGLLSLTMPILFFLGTDEFPLAPLPPDEVARGELDVKAYRSHLRDWRLREALGDSAAFELGSYQWALDRVDRVLRGPGSPTRGAFPALTYYRLSISQVYLLGPPDDVAWILDNREERPGGYHDGAQAEQCFLNAYKAIEALLGGKLSRSDRQLRTQIGKIGLDPDYAMALPDEERRTRFERIKRLREVRNTRAGHGGSTAPERTLLTHFDVFEAQWVANHAIGDALDAVSTG